MMELHYDEKDNGYLGSSKQYNGNIQAVTYQVFGVDRQSYGFAYDALDRMTRAQYGYLNNAGTLVFNSRYNESLSYDERGNIKNLSRNGTTGTCIITNPAVPSQQLPAFSFGAIDNLRYTYNTTQKNRLESIAESASTTYGFKVKSGVVTSTAKYEYDKNGNLVKDPYKKITEIRYNHLNLPEYIKFDESTTSRKEISIHYDAKGQKWSKRTRVMALSNTTPAYWNTLPENTYYYDSGIEYRTGNSTAPDILQTEEGRMVWIPTSSTAGYYGYEYAIRDHLGNTRVMVSDRNSDNKIDMKTEIMQVNHYYPFGMNQDGPWLAGNSGDHKYQYNGKELNTEFGLDLVDYSKRWYDAALGKFVSVDALAEKFPYNGTYNYAENRPVNGVDLDGLEWTHYQVGNKHILDVKVQIKYTGNALSDEQFKGYLAAANSFYNSILSNSSDGEFSGSITFDGETTNSKVVPNIRVDDEFNPSGIAGGGWFGAFGISTYDTKGKLQTANEFADDFVHELLHTLRVGHPFEVTQSEDTKLTKGKVGNNFHSTNNTSSSILTNLMVYNNMNIDCVSLLKLWKTTNERSLTRGQISFMANQIDKQMKGEGSFDDPNYNTYWDFLQMPGEEVKD